MKVKTKIIRGSDGRVLAEIVAEVRGEYKPDEPPVLWVSDEPYSPDEDDGTLYETGCHMLCFCDAVTVEVSRNVIAGDCGHPEIVD